MALLGNFFRKYLKKIGKFSVLGVFSRTYKRKQARTPTWGYLFCTGQIVQQMTVLLMSQDPVIAGGLKLTLYGGEG